jgi:hypothetical protein
MLRASSGLDAEIGEGAFELRISDEELYGSKVALATPRDIIQRDFRDASELEIARSSERRSPNSKALT